MMAPRRRKKSSCSALPLDIAGEVLLRLPSYADRICFGSVCRSWRASSAQHRSPPRFPCLVFGDGTFRGFPEGERPFRLPAAAVYHGSSGEWLVFKQDGGVGYSLANPFSKAATTVAPLPSLSCVRARHDHEPVLQAVAERVVSEYDLRWRALRGAATDPEPRALSLRKLVVCSADLVAAVIGDGRLGKIALCRPGAPSWSVSGHDQWRRLKDMATHRGTLYALDHNEDLLAISIGEDTHGEPAVSGITRVVTGAPPSFSVRRQLTLHYLVDLGGGALLMVRREVCRARPGQGCGIDERFTVFEANFMSRWEELRALGDGMELLVGRWCSAAVRVPEERRREWSGLIYFLEDGIVDQDNREYSLSAYNYNNGMGFRTYWLESVIWRDGHDLPATWLLPPQDGDMACVRRPLTSEPA